MTVIGREPEILPALDRDMAAYIRTLLERRGVVFHLDAVVERLSGRAGAVTAHVKRDGRELAITAAQICLAVGRRYNPRRAGTDALGLEMGRLGLRVSEHLRTSLPHIYAAGDAAGNQQLTPTAAYEGKLAARNALEGDVERVDYSVVPQTIFTTPEVGRVGLTHSEALARGVACHVARHDTKGASNGRATGEDAGYLKLVFDGADARLLSSQLSIHPSHGERLIKVFGHDHHEICEPD